MTPEQRMVKAIQHLESVETSSETDSKIAQAEGVVSFPYWPIATAPKDREIGILWMGYWVPAMYVGRDNPNGLAPWRIWGGQAYAKWEDLSIWSEIKSMAPATVLAQEEEIRQLRNVKPSYLYIETVSGQQFGVTDSLEHDSASEWEEFQKGELRCFRFVDGHFEELVGGSTWEPVKGWYRT